jgi:hypothetical protein
MSLFNPVNGQSATGFSLPGVGNTVPPPIPTGGDYTVNQFDPNQFSDPSNRAYDILSSFCGPELALTFSRYLGKSLTPDMALQISQQYGYRRGMGMSGPQSEDSLLTALGIPHEYRTGVDWSSLSQQVQSGAIAGVSTPGHYFALEGFNPTTGQFDTGNSGTAYRAGSRYLTPAQITSLGGAPQASYIVRQNQRGPEQLTTTTATTNYNNPYATRAAEIAQQYGIPPDIFVRMVKQESSFNPNARSGVGAQGLTQLMPATAAGLGVTNPYDPEQSLQGGAKFFSGLLKQFNGDVKLALAAYNAGPGAVQKYGGVPPYEETQRYLANILGGADPGSVSTGTSGLPQSSNFAAAAKPAGGLFGTGSIFSNGLVQPPSVGSLFGNPGSFLSLFGNY